MSIIPVSLQLRIAMDVVQYKDFDFFPAMASSKGLSVHSGDAHQREKGQSKRSGQVSTSDIHLQDQAAAIFFAK